MGKLWRLVEKERMSLGPGNTTPMWFLGGIRPYVGGPRRLAALCPGPLEEFMTAGIPVPGDTSANDSSPVIPQVGSNTSPPLLEGRHPGWPEPCCPADDSNVSTGGDVYYPPSTLPG